MSCLYSGKATTPTPLDVLVCQIEGHLVLIAGKPIGEPVVQRGPFVMCTQVFLSEFKFGFLVLLFFTYVV